MHFGARKVDITPTVTTTTDLASMTEEDRMKYLGYTSADVTKRSSSVTKSLTGLSGITGATFTTPAATTTSLLGQNTSLGA